MASTVTTTSSCSTPHRVTAVFIARATMDAWAHAASAPSASRPAAASDARSAAACARCRAITAEPTERPPTVTANSTAIIATATSPADPRSAQTRFDSGHRLRSDDNSRQQRQSRRDGGDDESSVATQLHRGAVGCDVARGVRCRTVVAARREPGGLPRGVDTTHLHRHGHEPGHAENEHDDQSSDRERRLDGDTAGLIA